MSPITADKKERIREAIRLEKEEGLDYIQIAARMGVRPPTASMYLREGTRGQRPRGPRKGKNPPERLSIRIDPDLYKRLSKRLRQLNKGVKVPAGRVTQRQLIEAAIDGELDADRTRQVYLDRGKDSNGDGGNEGAGAG